MDLRCALNHTFILRLNQLILQLDTVSGITINLVLYIFNVIIFCNRNYDIDTAFGVPNPHFLITVLSK